MRRLIALLSLFVAVFTVMMATSVAHATDPPMGDEITIGTQDNLVQTNGPAPTMVGATIDHIDHLTLNLADLGTPTRASPTGFLGHDAEGIAIVATATMDSYWLTTPHDLASTSLADTFTGAMASSTREPRVLDPEVRCRRYGADILSTP